MFLLRGFLYYPQLVNLRLVMFSSGGQSRVIVKQAWFKRVTTFIVTVELISFFIRLQYPASLLFFIFFLHM